MSDPEQTRARILDAATDAFSSHGLAGARVDAIAKAAGCNKQLLYHYFGNKAGLFEAVVLRVLSTRPPITWSSTQAVEEHIAVSMADLHRKGKWLRMMAWEALQSDDGTVVAEAQRKQALDESVVELEHAQALGVFDPKLSPRLLLLALMGMSMVPWLLPQHTRMMTGLSEGDPEFQDAYGKLMGAIVAKLGCPKRDS